MRRIRLKINGSILYAALNDSIAANDLIKRLPHSFVGIKNEYDCCFKTAIGIYDPLEMQCGWQIGDISLEKGWLCIHLDDKTSSINCFCKMVIGKLDDDSLNKLKKLESKLDLYIELI